MIWKSVLQIKKLNKWRKNKKEIETKSLKNEKQKRKVKQEKVMLEVCLQMEQIIVLKQVLVLALITVLSEPAPTIDVNGGKCITPVTVYSPGSKYKITLLELLALVALFKNN